MEILILFLMISFLGVSVLIGIFCYGCGWDLIKDYCGDKNGNKQM